MRCNISSRVGRLPQASPSSCPIPLSGTRLPRGARLQCEASPAADGNSSSGGGASSSSRITPQAQPLKQQLPGYAPTSVDAESTTAGALGHTPNGPGPHPAAPAQPSSAPGTIERGSWEWWTAYFNAMDDTVRELDGIDEELQAAVEVEDYGKAAALRIHQKRLEAADCVGAVLDEMETAIQEERYSDAAALRDTGGAGLMGWWSGHGDDDPHGHLINVTSDFGRYVAHAYSGINLAELAGIAEDAGASGAISTFDLGPARESSGDPEEIGSPVFEVFVRKDPDDGSLAQQATALQAPVMSLASPGVLDDLTELLSREVGGGATVSVERGKDDDGLGFVRINVTGVSDDGSAFPDSDDEDEDGSARTQAFMSEDNLDDEADETIHTIDDLMNLFEAQEAMEREAQAQMEALQSMRDSSIDSDSESIPISEENGGEPMPSQEMVDAWVEIDGRLERMKLEELVAGAVAAQSEMAGGDETTPNLQDMGDTLSEMGLGVIAQRVPASIEWQGRDAFTFVVAEDLVEKQATQALVFPAEEDIQSEAVEALIAEAPAKPDGSLPEKTEISSSSQNAVAGPEKKKVTAAEFTGRLDEIESMVKKAMGNAIAQGIGATSTGNDGILGLAGRVSYTRLPTDDCTTDVFSGIYLGTFGPHGPEVLRVARKVIDGEEWVHGTKLTGDPNVPVGKVSFRARIGRSQRLSASGAYPPEYGVQQRYKGQGRVAREGYSAAKWVEGELLTFSASNPMTRGAELGFVFNIDAARKYLLLFTKVKLDKLTPTHHMQ